MGTRPPGIGAVLFVGVGQMGQPMAARLANAGFDLTLSDLDLDRTTQIAVDLGVAVLPRTELADATARFRTVILMLPASPIVEEVLTGEGGLLSRLERGSVVIDMSSSEPASTVALARSAAERGIGFLDAPVSGGVPKARTGELSIMVGGKPTDFESRAGLLSAMGTMVTHVGASGAGHAMKALNNLLSAIGMVGASEVLAIAAGFGIEPRVALDVINGSTGRNQATEVKFGRYMLSRRFDSGFAMRLMVKDLRIALGLAHESGIAAPISAGALEEWTAANASLGLQADHTEIAAYVERRAGLELAERSDDLVDTATGEGKAT